MRIFVTVGMGSWPFDRLLMAVIPLCDQHEVLVQRGNSKVPLPCNSVPFLSFKDTLQHIAQADIIITHAGNTVRLVQQQGKLPIAMAREKRFQEMANDHQVPYLHYEAQIGRVLALWNPQKLPLLVNSHPTKQVKFREHLHTRKVTSDQEIYQTMTALCQKWHP